MHVNMGNPRALKGPHLAVEGHIGRANFAGWLPACVPCRCLPNSGSVAHLYALISSMYRSSTNWAKYGNSACWLASPTCMAVRSSAC